MTTKISWNDTNRLPYDTFCWKGMDGTEVTAHFITTTDPGEDYYTYNGNTSPDAIKGVWEQYKNKDSNKDLLISFGFGDGGGGPTRTQIKQAEAAGKIPGLPHVKMEMPTEYFRRLNRTLKENPMDGYIPVWDGELYLEFHRGTYTSQAYNKKMNRRMEYLLRDTEMLSVLAGAAAGVPYDYDNLLKAWKIVLCHQFHDILPGSSIKEVYEDSHVEYGRALQLIKETMEAVNQTLYGPEAGCYTVFNNSNWMRSGATFIHMADAELSHYKGHMVIDKDGQEVKAVWKENGVLIWVFQIQPFSFSAFRIVAKKSRSYRCRAVRD
uniref:glycoside hydrolase family 38 N-terminal domain-containing protein n=1 Tax=Clostridium sp. NkU-1 TaxID=1095009 RepID=UPI0006D0BD5A